MNKYRKRISKIKKTTKPNVINRPDSASLLDWLRAYPIMRQPGQARRWFANHHFSRVELAATYEAGFQVLAIELGYIRQPLEIMSKPMVATIKPSTEHTAAA